MKKIQSLTQVVMLFVVLPYQIYQGQKKQAYKDLKQAMIAAELL